LHYQGHDHREKVTNHQVFEETETKLLVRHPTSPEFARKLESANSQILEIHACALVV